MPTPSDEHLPSTLEVIGRVAGNVDPYHANADRPRGTLGELARRPSKAFSEILPRVLAGREEASVRLVKSRHRIRITPGRDVQPGQLCVVVEVRRGEEAEKGEEAQKPGTDPQGLWALRARLPAAGRRRLMVARLEAVSEGEIRLGWDSRPDTLVRSSGIALVGKVVGTRRAGPWRLAPLLTIFSN